MEGTAAGPGGAAGGHEGLRPATGATSARPAGVAFTFVDIVAAAMQGSGGIDFEIGGVLATTEGIDYGDPFGLIAPGLPDRSAGGAAGGAAPPGRAERRPSRSRPDPGRLTAAELPGRRPPRLRPSPARRRRRPGLPAASAGTCRCLPVTRRCESTSRGRVSGCSRGAPLPAGAGALGAAAAAVRRRLVAHPPPVRPRRCPDDEPVRRTAGRRRTHALPRATARSWPWWR